MNKLSADHTDSLSVDADTSLGYLGVACATRTLCKESLVCRLHVCTSVLAALYEQCVPFCGAAPRPTLYDTTPLSKRLLTNTVSTLKVRRKTFAEDRTNWQRIQ